jgi:hypothetical protein
MENNYLKLIEENIGNILGVIGIILAYYFYYKSKSTKELYYEITSFNLIGKNIKDKISDIQILYKDNRIKYLTISKIAIWNSGNQTVWENEIPENNKIQISICDSYDILECEILQNDDLDTNLTLTKIDNKKLELNFKFLEPNKGFILKIIHTSITSNDLTVKGRVIGSSNIKRINDFGRNNIKREHWSAKYFAFIFGCFIIFVSTRKEVSYNIFIFLFGFMFVAVSFVQIILKKVPKRYEKIYQDE